MGTPGSPLHSPLLSVVIPAFNESDRIVPTLDKIAVYLERQTFSWEVLVVDDGSVDNTSDLVTRWAGDRENVRLLAREHFGKGWAVRAGMLEAKGRFRFMCDADLAMPIEWVDAFLQRMEAGVGIVIGSREAEGARRYDEPGYRHIMGRVFNRVVRLMAVKGIEDTQCGFKCFREDAASDLFRRQRIRGMGFDAEILYLAQKKGYTIEEMPVDWYFQTVSKVRPVADTIDMFKDTVLIRLRDIFGRYG